MDGNVTDSFFIVECGWMVPSVWLSFLFLAGTIVSYSERRTESQKQDAGSVVQGGSSAQKG
jgi:hypothetical protein